MANWSRLILVFAILCLSCQEAKSPASAPLISSRSLRQDFTILRETLEQAHPGLYWYSSKEQMDHRFDSMYGLLKNDLSRAQFFKFLLPLIANVRCVHTSIGMLPLKSGANEFNSLLPFDFFITHDQRLFLADEFKTKGHTGAEALSINGIPARDIIQKLMTCIPADGYNETFKYQLLKKGAFREGYGLYFEQPEDFTLEIRERTGLTTKLIAKGVNPRELPVKKTQKQELMDARFDDKLSLLILTLNTFEISRDNFEQRISSIFKEASLRKSQNLIIDLRNNGGGHNDNVSALYAFIADKPFQHLKSAEMNAQKFTHFGNVTNPEAFSNLRQVPNEAGNYDMSYRYRGIKVQEPEGVYAFSGNVILLTSGNTTSAASEFAAIAHSNKRATIIGEESGGCYYGATGGIYFNLILPASKLTVRIPTIKILTAVQDDDVKQPVGRGVMPDIEVLPEVNEILEKKDAVMEKALEFVSSKMTGQRN